MPNQQHNNFFIFFLTKTNKTNKQTNKKTMYFSTPPNLNDTLFPMWQEIQYSGVRKPECAKARASPKLEYQNTCQKLIAIFFFHRNKHQKVDCY
jgi:hypothetical protein